MSDVPSFPTIPVLVTSDQDGAPRSGAEGLVEDQACGAPRLGPHAITGGSALVAWAWSIGRLRVGAAPAGAASAMLTEGMSQ